MQSGTMHSMLEYTHINEMQTQLRRKLSESQRKDLGRMDSLRSSILGMVVGENYDRSKEELLAYVELKTEFPTFQFRAQRYVQHCVELIQAIQTKRNFPGLASLSLAKQQEIHEKVIDHFEELKGNLKQIEKIEREQKLNDVRSTVWVIRMVCFCTLALIAAGLVLDIKSGGFNSSWSVIERIIDGATGTLLGFLRL